jgi:hypothetical protein
MCAFVLELEPEFKEWREWMGWEYEYCTLCNCWNWNGKHPNTDVHKRNVNRIGWQPPPGARPAGRPGRRIDRVGPGHRLGGAAAWDPDAWTWNAPADKEAEDAPAENELYEVCEACNEPCNGMCPRVQMLLIRGMTRKELEAYSLDKVDCMWRCPTCHTAALRATPAL